MASAKFKIIAEMESHFAIKPFELELWRFKKKPAKESDGWVAQKCSRWTLTHFDQVLPSLIALTSAIYLIYKILLSL